VFAPPRSICGVNYFYDPTVKEFSGISRDPLVAIVAANDKTQQNRELALIPTIFFTAPFHLLSRSLDSPTKVSPVCNRN
jgi:hypothetical protein